MVTVLVYGNPLPRWRRWLGVYSGMQEQFRIHAAECTETEPTWRRLGTVQAYSSVSDVADALAIERTDCIHVCSCLAEAAQRGEN